MQRARHFVLQLAAHCRRSSAAAASGCESLFIYFFVYFAAVVFLLKIPFNALKPEGVREAAARQLLPPVSHSSSRRTRCSTASNIWLDCGHCREVSCFFISAVFNVPWPKYKRGSVFTWTVLTATTNRCQTVARGPNVARGVVIFGLTGGNTLTTRELFGILKYMYD